MASLTIHRVNALPEELQESSLYVVKRMEYGLAELVFTTTDGDPLKVIDTAAVQTLISSAINNASHIHAVNTIAERDALQLDGNSVVFVVNTDGDAEAGNGSALYFYTKDTDTYTLLVNLNGTKWASIIDGPESSAEDIDDAVNKRHTHSNSGILESLSEVDDVLYYKDKPVSNVSLDTIEW